MSEKGSQGLVDDWLDEAISDLSRAVETYRYRPEFWYQLGVAHAFRGPSEDAAEAFSHCSRYAASDAPRLAAASVLLAAEQFRSIDQESKARDLLHKFLPPLDRCAEIHLNLAKYHGESDHVKRALELAPLLAATARAEGVASVEDAAAEVCRHEDGSVSRLRKLEEAIHGLIEAVKGIGLDYFNEPSAFIDLPNFGVDALLKAEVNIPSLAEKGRKLASAVAAGLAKLEAYSQDCWQRYQEAKMSGDNQVKEAQQRAHQAKERARQNLKALLDKEIQLKDRTDHAYLLAEEKLQQATAESVKAQRRLGVLPRTYDLNGRMRAEALERFREIPKENKKVNGTPTGDEDYDYLIGLHYSRHGLYDYSALSAWARLQSADMWKINVSNIRRDEVWMHVPYDEIELHRLGEEMIGERGEKIRAELAADSERARQNVEHAAAGAGAAQESVRRQTEFVKIVRQRMAEGGDLHRTLQVSEQQADRACQETVLQIEEKIQCAKLRYESAGSRSRQSKEAIASFLEMLEVAIQSSTASRNRIIPSV
jgi:hypothetical protein